MNRNILLTGSTGFIGSAVLKRLNHSTGLNLRLLLHKKIPELHLSAHDEYRYCDLACPETFNDICDGVDAVLHLASYIGDDQYLCEAVNARGTEALADQAKRAGAKRFLYLSNAAVYGYAVHRNADETEATVDPATAISRSRVRAEQAVLDNNGIVLRPLFVYGHGDTHFIPALIRALERFPFMIDGGRARLSVISVDDLAEVLVDLATDEWSQKHQGVFHVNDGHPVSFKEIAVSLAACVGSRLPPFSVPLFIAQSMVRLTRRGIFQKSGLNSSAHRIFLVARDHYYDASRLWNLVSVKPGPPLPENLGQYKDWYRRFVHAERKG